MNKIKKIGSFIVAILIILITISTFNISLAAFPIQKAQLYTKGEYTNLLIYDGIRIGTNFVVYQENGVEYPAYCLQKERQGAEGGSYATNVDSLISDIIVWRTIINGYPYKTYAELGCDTAAEAFVATKMAVYNHLYSYDLSKFQGVGEAGNRVLNAIKKIVQDAENSRETKISSDISIVAQNEEWKIDAIDSQYLSKTYSIRSAISLSNCKITTEGKLPENSKITDTNNIEKNSFNSTENFKILIPIKNLQNYGEFKIKASASMNTKPIFLGKAPSSDLQDYALTASRYEEGSGSKTEGYVPNNTCIKIIKQNGENMQGLKGAEFNLLDKDKNILYSNLTTNEQGQIVLENFLPGKYYLQEVKTLEGYGLYDQLIAFTIDFNQSMGITIYNYKTEKEEQHKDEVQITVGQKDKEVNVSDKETNITINKDNTTIHSEKESTTINQEKHDIKLPKTGM